MARGWESKSVEEQMASAAEHRRRPEAQPDAALVEKQRKRDSLLLSRTRVLHDLEAAKGGFYKEQLEAALQHLERGLAALDADSGTSKAQTKS